MKNKIFIFTVLVFLNLQGSIFAQSVSATNSAPDWIEDSKGCKIWNPSPQPNETVVWAGSCVDGFASGSGTVDWFIDKKPNGSSSGMYEQGKLIGRGVLVSGGGSRYEGDIVDGLPSGAGSIIFSNGNRYDGAFLNGRRTGQGFYIFKNGDSYSGEFLDGKFHGRGVITRRAGERYEGQFVDGKMQGRALLIRSDGQRVSGVMVDGKFNPDSNQIASHPPLGGGERSSNESLIRDGHSVESIRQALRSPIPQSVQNQARQFDDQLVKLGRAGDQAIYLVLDNRHLRASKIVNSLLSAFGSDPSNWVVRVLETKTPQENAFVVGGKYIYVFTGLIDSAQSDDELAFIFGHEIAHSLLKHNLRRKEDFGQLLSSLIELSGAFSKNTERREKRALLAGAMKSAYSREDEREADALAAYIAKRASFNPEHGINFFNRALKREREYEEKNQAELDSAKGQIERQLTNCERLRMQWNASPNIRTHKNAQILNSECQLAEENKAKYDRFLAERRRVEAKSELISTHPADQDRIAALIASVDYLNGRRALHTLSNLGQGYRVFLALDLQ